MIRNNRTGIRGQRHFHDFTRVDRGEINGPVEHIFGAQHSMLVIEEDAPKHFRLTSGQGRLTERFHQFRRG